MSKASDQIASELESAKTASRQCSICNGVGLVPIYHPQYRGNSTETSKDGRLYPATGAAHCRCDMGKWVRDRTDELYARLIPRVEDIIDRRSKWLLEPPVFTPSQAPEEREFAPRGGRICPTQLQRLAIAISAISAPSISRSASYTPNETESSTTNSAHSEPM